MLHKNVDIWHLNQFLAAVRNRIAEVFLRVYNSIDHNIFYIANTHFFIILFCAYTRQIKLDAIIAKCHRWRQILKCLGRFLQCSCSESPPTLTWSLMALVRLLSLIVGRLLAGGAWYLILKFVIFVFCTIQDVLFHWWSVHRPWEGK